jgi:hypothetical protein
MITFITVTREEIAPDWIALRRAVVLEHGYALRGAACAGGYTIELKSQTPRESLAIEGWRPLNTWGPLGWHHGALRFATAAERDAVLERLRQPQGAEADNRESSEERKRE